MSQFVFSSFVPVLKRAALAACAAALCMVPAVAFAQDVAISSSILIESKVEAGGTTKSEWVVAETVVPGDTIKLAVAYRNKNAEALTNFVITSPVPGAVRVKDIAPDHVVSVDNGKTFDRFDKLRVADAQGNLVAAMPDQITHMRWVIETIAVDGTGSVDYLVTVR